MLAFWAREKVIAFIISPKEEDKYNFKKDQGDPMICAIQFNFNNNI